MSDKSVRIEYRNWRGEQHIRTVLPTGRMEFTSTEWHPVPQWLFEAVDPEDGNTKMFSMRGVVQWG